MLAAQQVSSGRYFSLKYRMHKLWLTKQTDSVRKTLKKGESRPRRTVLSSHQRSVCSYPIATNSCLSSCWYFGDRCNRRRESSKMPQAFLAIRYLDVWLQASSRRFVRSQKRKKRSAALASWLKSFEGSRKLPGNPSSTPRLRRFTSVRKESFFVVKCGI